MNRDTLFEFLAQFEKGACAIGFVSEDPEHFGACSTMLQQTLLLTKLLDGDGPFRIVRKEDLEAICDE